MAKKTIKLTESELHNLIKESVKKVLEEGQGWDTFKKGFREIKSSDEDNEKGHGKQKFRNFVNTGDIEGRNFRYYHPNNPTVATTYKDGAKEIVLTGVNTGDFGRHTGESFIDLLRSLEKIQEIERYRISSIEPNLLTDEIIQFVANSKKFMPHFHIPLQSGSNDVLKIMKRRYNRELFKQKINTIKQLIPHAFIGVDVIVGTRGETDQFFNDSKIFIENLDISQLHVFT